MIAPTEIPGASIISATETIDLEGVSHHVAYVRDGALRKTIIVCIETGYASIVLPGMTLSMSSGDREEWHTDALAAAAHIWPALTDEEAVA
jgi:hypothetical protein